MRANLWQGIDLLPLAACHLHTLGRGARVSLSGAAPLTATEQPSSHLTHSKQRALAPTKPSPALRLHLQPRLPHKLGNVAIPGAAPLDKVVVCGRSSGRSPQ